MLTHKKGGKFKSYMLGQVGATVTTPELYFMWCMLKGVKVHLGYWMAIAINAVRTRTDRHLYTCNLLGAFDKRNVAMTIADSVTDLPLCYAPRSFDLPFFFNKGLTSIRDGMVTFYVVGKQEGVTVKTEREETEVKAKDADDEWKKRMEEMVVSQKGMITVQTKKLT